MSSRSRPTRTVSLLFWYVGLLPDLATLRDRAKNRWRAVHLRHSSRWAGGARPATGIATVRPTCSWPVWRRPLVVSVHTSCRSISRSRSCRAGTRTIFPPYFVAGAIFSGFAMVADHSPIPLRAAYGLHDFITRRATSTTWPRSCWRPA